MGKSSVTWWFTTPPHSLFKLVSASASITTVNNAHLSANMTMLRLSIGGGQSLRQGSALLHRFQSAGSCCHYAPSSTAAHHFVRRSFADDAKKDAPKGMPYSKLTVGVPKETFPLEKRVAATPDVRIFMLRVRGISRPSTNTLRHELSACISIAHTYLYVPDDVLTCFCCLFTLPVERCKTCRAWIQRPG